MATIGLTNLYYAVQNSDTASETTYGTPVRIAGAITVDINPSVSTNTLYADNIGYYVSQNLSEIQVQLETADLGLETIAALLGHKYDADKNTLTYSTEDAAPYVAIMAQADKADGETRFFKLLKGKFADGQETINTKGENIEYTTPTLTGTFVSRLSDGAWKIVKDVAKADVAATESAWYASVDGTDDTNS